MIRRKRRGMKPEAIHQPGATMNFQQPAVTSFPLPAAVIVLFLAFSLLPGLVLAGDTSQVKVIGFSTDGRYMAYLRYGNSDGSGQPYADLFFVDVPNNNFVKPWVLKERGREDESDDGYEKLTRVKKRALMIGESPMSKYGIRQFFTAENIIYRSQGTDKRGVFEMEFATDQLDLMLRLEPREAPNSACNDLFGPPLIFTLSISDAYEGENPNFKILQKDKKLYRSRGCVFSYAFNQLLVYRGGIVVFIDASVPGFEGPDVRQLVVTGTLPGAP